MKADVSISGVRRLTIDGKRNNRAGRDDRCCARFCARCFLRRIRTILFRVYDRTDRRMAREATVLGDYTIVRYRAQTQRETVRRETVPRFQRRAPRCPPPLSLSLSFPLRNASRRADNGANAPIRCAASSRRNCAEALEQSFTALRGRLARRYILLRVSRQAFKIAPLRERIGRTRRARAHASSRGVA